MDSNDMQQIRELEMSHTWKWWSAIFFKARLDEDQLFIE